MRIKLVLLILAVSAFTSVLYAQVRGIGGGAPVPESQTSTQQPSSTMQTGSEMDNRAKRKGQAQGLTEKEVAKEIKSGPPESVINDVKQHGVDFDMTPDIEKKLRKLKATDEVIEAVRQAGPTVRAHTAKLSFGPGDAGAQQIPIEQAKAFDAIKGELDNDKAIALVNDFAKNYPQSPLLSYVYSLGASSYQQKGDLEKIVEYTDKALKLKPDNLLALMLRIGMLPQPQYLNRHDADRDKILKEAEEEANHALQLVSQIPKQPNETDADYQKRLANIASAIHGSLGMVHLEVAHSSLAGPDKDELAKSEQEFTTAVTTANRPDPRDYYRLGEVDSMEGKIDAAIQAFTKSSELGQGTMIKTYADQRIADLKNRKAHGSAASKP